MKRWSVYRIDAEPRDYYIVWSPTRDAALHAAKVEFFGVVLLTRMLSATL